jgi:hypothetical protein
VMTTVMIAARTRPVRASVGVVVMPGPPSNGPGR